MARYKRIDTGPRFLAVDLARQLLPGTFEHALNHLIDHELDLTAFDARFRNDAAGAIAVDLDLAKFFDNVDHDILMARVARRVSDKRLLALIGRYPIRPHLHMAR